MTGGHQQPQEEDWIRAFVKKHCSQQLELPLSILWNSVESDLGCTLGIYFDNMTMTLHNVTLASQRPCQLNNKCDCSKTNG